MKKVMVKPPAKNRGVRYADLPSQPYDPSSEDGLAGFTCTEVSTIRVTAAAYRLPLKTRKDYLKLREAILKANPRRFDRPANAGAVHDPLQDVPVVVADTTLNFLKGRTPRDIQRGQDTYKLPLFYRQVNEGGWRYEVRRRAPDEMTTEQRMSVMLSGMQDLARASGQRVPVSLSSMGVPVYAPDPPPVLEAPAARRFVPADKGPAVIDTIISILTTRASRKAPITRRQLHEQLVAAIPQRDPDKLLATVKAQLCESGLISRGVDLRGSVKDGFWIAPAKK